MFGVINVLLLLAHATARALAAQVTQEHLDDGLVYPPFQSIRKISANIAAAVADKAYELGIYKCFYRSILQKIKYLLVNSTKYKTLTEKT